MIRVRAVIIDGPANASTLAAIRAELERQPEQTIVVAGPSVREIAERVAFEMGVALTALVGERRDRPVYRARAAVAWLAQRLTTKSLVQIGRVLGDRDHSTIIHAVRRADELRGRDPAFKQLTDRLAAEFEGEQHV